MAKAKLTPAQQAHIDAKAKVEALEAARRTLTADIHAAEQALWEAEIAIELESPLSEKARELLMHLKQGELARLHDGQWYCGDRRVTMVARQLDKRGLTRIAHGGRFMDITMRGEAVAERLAAR